MIDLTSIYWPLLTYYSTLFTVSGWYSEEELEEKQQELRNTLDEQFGQNMMVIKESVSKQYEDAQNSLKKELETAKQQVRKMLLLGWYDDVCTPLVRDEWLQMSVNVYWSIHKHLTCLVIDCFLLSVSGWMASSGNSKHHWNNVLFYRYLIGKLGVKMHKVSSSSSYNNSWQHLIISWQRDTTQSYSRFSRQQLSKESLPTMLLVLYVSPFCFHLCL